MLSKEQNKLLVETDAGTPCGVMMRRYWQPAALSEELGHDAPLVRHVRRGERRLDAAQYAKQGNAVAIPQMADPENASLELAQPGPERDVELGQSYLAEPVRVVPVRQDDRRQHWGMGGGIGAEDLEAPPENRLASSGGKLQMPLEDGVQPLVEQHRSGFP